MEVPHRRLDVVEADVRDAGAVDTAVRGTDVVFNVAGQTKDSDGPIMRVTAEHVTRSMERHGVDRLIALAGAGLSHPKDEERSFSGKVIMAIMKRVAGGVLEDAEAYGEIIMSSDLRWTIVRPPRLAEGPGHGEYEAGYLQLGLGHTVERGDVARFMLECAEEDLWVREAPMVTD